MFFNTNAGCLLIFRAAVPIIFFISIITIGRVISGDLYSASLRSFALAIQLGIAFSAPLLSVFFCAKSLYAKSYVDGLGWFASAVVSGWWAWDWRLLLGPIFVPTFMQIFAMDALSAAGLFSQILTLTVVDLAMSFALLARAKFQSRSRR